jgi:dTDP-4-dehydrorhamnose reductase
MRVLVTGSAGQLGADIVAALTSAGEVCIPVTRADADLVDASALMALLARERPDAIVNCAALHDVARCEMERELATAINATAVEALASGAAHLGARFMTVSTDYVFDGTAAGGYTERDRPSPVNHYGTSKLDGEQRALAANPQTFVVRTQSLFGLTRPSGKGLNFVELMLSLADERDEIKVDQYRMAPTSTASLAANMVELLRTDHYGLYHMSCDGETTWFEFAERILERAGSETRVVAVGNDYYATPFARPESTYLINARLRALGLDRMPRWEDALDAYLEARRRLGSQAMRGHS